MTDRAREAVLRQAWEMFRDGTLFDGLGRLYDAGMLHAPMEWRPISEAPKDGTRIVGLIDNRRARVVFWGDLYWSGQDWIYDHGGVCGEYGAVITAWAPLPPPPGDRDHG
ncbi:hypothetical protein ACFOGJ_16020 [Marinibaculum pumilum]|uniref:DUF551 domain-containing protein n=1 Tax=Marinibaculum pumilum TaxID=1766165 RepID=A0ABV7L255_9PROT